MKLAAECPPGAVVELVDSRSKKVLGHAKVLHAHTGVLCDLAFEHAEHAHNWKGEPKYDEEGHSRSYRLIASMMKRYPPGRVKDDSVCTVLYLQKIEEEPTP